MSQGGQQGANEEKKKRKKKSAPKLLLLSLFLLNLSLDDRFSLLFKKEVGSTLFLEKKERKKTIGIKTKLSLPFLPSVPSHMDGVDIAAQLTIVQKDIDEVTAQIAQQNKTQESLRAQARSRKGKKDQTLNDDIHALSETIRKLHACLELFDIQRTMLYGKSSLFCSASVLFCSVLSFSFFLLTILCFFRVFGELGPSCRVIPQSQRL